MEFTIKKLDKYATEIEFTSTAKEYDDAVNTAYERNKHKYDIQGFRKGKAPRRVIESTYGDGVFFEDAFTELAEMAFDQFKDEHDDAQFFGEPSLNLVSFADNIVKGKIIVKIMPEIKLGKYKGLDLEVSVDEFNEAMVEEELKHAQLHHTHSHPAEGKVSALGDIVVIDFVGSTDGVEFEGGKATDYELELGSHSFIDTFEDQLVGHKSGDHVTVTVNFPKEYGAQALAGKKAVFECDIKSVNTKHIPEIDDELAKHVAGVNTLAEWKKEIEAQLRHEIEAKNKAKMEDAIIEKIVETSEVDLPDEYIENQLDMVMRDLAQRLAYQGMRIEDYANYIGTTMDALREERRPDAIRIAKTRQVLDAIVRKEDFAVSDAEIDDKLAEIAKMSNKSLQEYKKTVDKKRIDYIYSDILMSKLLGFLTANNKITITTAKEEVKKPVAKKATAAKTATKAETKKPAAKKPATTKTAAKKPAAKKTTK